MEPETAIPGFDDGSVFRSLFAAYPDALLLVDLQGAIVLANPTAYDLLGYPAGALVGLSVDALVPDAIRPRHAAYRDAYNDHPRPRPMGLNMDLVAKRRDGSEVMVEIALSPLKDKGLPFVVAAIRGVGAYPRVRQALQRARYADALAQFGRLAVDARDPHRLMEQVPAVAVDALQVETALIVLLEPSGLELRIAAAAGPLAAQAVGDRLPNHRDSPCGHVIAHGQPVLVDDYAQQERFKISAPYLEAGTVCELAVPLSDRGRTIGALVVLSRAPSRFGDDELRFLDSMSSLLATVLQRAQSEDALSHSQRLESIGQLTGGVAHDFNNLLTVISGNLQVLEDVPSCADDPVARQLIGAASRATWRGAELTGKLLAFSRRQVLQPVTVDTGALLSSLADLLRRTLDQRIAITLETEEAWCLADPGQLEAALLNIAINARDAMPAGGTLSFACKATPALPDDPDGERGDPAPDGYVEIAVADTGCGMPAAVKERAFEPFFTTKDAGRGTGLGLSTVYGFARQSRGAVRLRSTPNVGTTVTLYLPRVREEGQAQVPSHDAAEVGPQGLRVLVVEDDAEVRSVAQSYLASMNCEVVPCATAEQALPLLATDAPFDLLFTDVALGTGMRGTELADRARQLRPGLPVLLTSGYSSELLAAPSTRELLRKPYSRTELERAITRAMAKTQ